MIDEKLLLYVAEGKLTELTIYRHCGTKVAKENSSNLFPENY